VYCWDMHKRKYTKEQLEFYFKKLMNELHRVPREEDISQKEGYPSVKAYSDRFGSWQNAVNMFANFDLSKRKCVNCGKVLIKKKKTHKFCSAVCAKEYYQKKATKYTKNIEKNIKAILDNKCFVCDFSAITEVHCLDNKKESTSKILKAYNKKSMHEYVLLCPNHHLMTHRKLAELKYRNNELVWQEQV
jgi:hypothetical protein